MVQRYEAEGKAKRISAVPAPEVVFEEVVKVVDPLFSVPRTQVGGLHCAIIRCHKGPPLACRPSRQHGLNITARPAHRQAALLCAVLLAAVASPLHVMGYGAQQLAVARHLHVTGCTALSSIQQLHVWHCMAPPSRSRTTACCALHPLRRSATSRVRQPLSRVRMAVLRGKQADQGAARSQPLVYPAFPSPMEPHVQVCSTCSMV